MDLSKLTTGEKVVAGAGILLVIDLLFFPWHKLDLGILSVSRTAIESPKAFWGVLALLLTIAVVAAVLVTRLTTARLPALPVPFGQAVFFAGIGVLALLVIKLALETDFLGFGAWLGLLLAAALAYGGFMMRQEEGTATGPPPMGPTI